MTQDWDAIRALVLKISRLFLDSYHANVTETFVALPKDATDEMHHIRFLLNENVLMRSIGGAVGLTIRGYSFLDEIQNERIWAKTRAAILAETDELSVKQVMSIARSIRREEFDRRP